MVDVVDVATRSKMMSGIRGRNTKPEVTLRHALHALGLRYRLHSKALPGKPDLVLPRFRAAVFVHGCFWHRHEGCRFTTTPATRPEFWSEKFEGNVERDRRNLEALQKSGWRTAVVWECAIKAEGAKAVADRVEAWLRSDQQTLTVSTK
jgi:DNA mismatch endonuclease (patch repair protein)